MRGCNSFPELNCSARNVSTALSNFGAGTRWHGSLGPPPGHLGGSEVLEGDNNTVLGRKTETFIRLQSLWRREPALRPRGRFHPASGLHRPGAGSNRLSPRSEPAAASSACAGERAELGPSVIIRVGPLPWQDNGGVDNHYFFCALWLL